MLKKLLAAMVAATLMAGTAWGADTKDIGGSGSNLLTNSSDAVASSSTSDIDVSATNLAIGSTKGGALQVGTIASTGNVSIGTLAGVVFGGNNGGVPQKFSLTATSISSGGGITMNGTVAGGVTEMTLNGNLTAGATLAQLTVNSVKFTQTAGRMSVEGGVAAFTNSIVDIKGGIGAAAGSTYKGLNLTGGSYKDGGDVYLTDGSIWDGDASINITGKVVITDMKPLTIKGGSDATVGSFEWTGAGGTTPLTVNEGSSLTVNNNTTINSWAQILNIGANDTAATGKSSVEFKGELKFTGEENNGGLTGANGALLKANTLIIGEDSNDPTNIKATGLDVTVKGLTTINRNSSYTVDGTADVYEGGITVTGVGTSPTVKAGKLIGLTDNVNTTIDTKSAFVTLKDGGAIEASHNSSKTFTIKGEGVKIENDGTDANKAVIDANTKTAKIVIEKDLNVAGNLTLTTGAVGDSMITVGTYTQTSGTVIQDTAGQLTVKGDASISGNGSTFTVIATGVPNNVTTFEKGLTIANGATVQGVAGVTQIIDIGDSQTITLNGGTLDGQLGGMFIRGDNVRLVTTGEDNTINNIFAQNIDFNVNDVFDGATTTMLGGQNAFNSVTVSSGELGLAANSFTNVANGFTVKKDVIVSNYGDVGIVGAGPGTNGAANSFNANSGSYIEARNGTFAIAGFNAVNLNGNLMLDNQAGTVNTITALGNTAVNLGGSTKVIFTPEAAAAIAAGDQDNGQQIIIADEGALNVKGFALQQNNILGQFTFAREDETAAGDYIYLAAKQSVLPTYDSYESRLTALHNLNVAWGPMGAAGALDYSIASAAYDVVVPGNTGGYIYDPVYGTAGVNNAFRELLWATAYTDTAKVGEGTFKSVFGNGDVSDMLNVGIGEIRAVSSAIGMRNRQLRGQIAGAVESEYANASMMMNSDYANRIWAGYLGQWEQADRRHGVEGYDYDSHGFILGYDRLIGCNFAFGGAFAYTRGTYEDKAADSGDGKIDNYSFNGYATYSAANGFYASLFGGYTHQKNDISAQYRTAHKSADYDSDYWNLGAELGYDFVPVDSFTLTPSIGLQYIHGKAESHTSSIRTVNGTFASGAVGSATAKALLLPIELAARYDLELSNCGKLTFEGNVGYSYNFDNDGGAASMRAVGMNNANGSPLVFNGREREQSRHTWNAGAGLRYSFNRFDVGVKYDYYWQQDSDAHRVMGTVGVSF